jgi:ParB-like chromosome segregation protein Spo0J
MPRGITPERDDDVPAGREVVQVRVEELDLRFAELRLVNPKREAWLRASIERDGLRSPVLASTGVEPGRRVLLDGVKRLKVARALGMTTVWAVLVEADPCASLLALLSANAAQAGLTALEEGWVLRRLCREMGLSQQQVGALLGRDQSFVSRRVRLAEQLEQRLQDDVRLGLLSPASARELARLPRGSHQVQTQEALQAHGLSSRQTAALVRLLLGTAEPGARRQILDDPLAALAGVEGRRPAAVDVPLGTQGQALWRCLSLFETASLRLCQALGASLPAPDEARLAAPMGEGLALARRVVRTLGARCRAAGEAGP